MEKKYLYKEFETNSIRGIAYMYYKKVNFPSARNEAWKEVECNEIMWGKNANISN